VKSLMVGQLIQEYHLAGLAPAIPGEAIGTES
jgi:hypothetical protein